MAEIILYRGAVIFPVDTRRNRARVCATIIIKDQKTMGNFTLTSSDKNTTSDLASRTVMTAGGTLSNGVENKAGILLRIFNSIRVAPEADRSQHRPLRRPVGYALDRRYGTRNDAALLNGQLELSPVRAGTVDSAAERSNELRHQCNPCVHMDQT
jgi:hypothetical protein